MSKKTWPPLVKGPLIGIIIAIIVLIILSAILAESMCNSWPNADWGVRVDGYDGGKPYRNIPCSSTEIMQTFREQIFLWNGYLLASTILIGAILGGIISAITGKIKSKKR